MKFADELKTVLYYIGIGIALIVYAHANFSTKETQMRLEEEVREINKAVAKKDDIKRVEVKVDKLIFKLIGVK